MMAPFAFVQVTQCVQHGCLWKNGLARMCIENCCPQNVPYLLKRLVLGILEKEQTYPGNVASGYLADFSLRPDNDQLQENIAP